MLLGLFILTTVVASAICTLNNIDNNILENVHDRNIIYTYNTWL